MDATVYPYINSINIGQGLLKNGELEVGPCKITLSGIPEETFSLDANVNRNATISGLVKLFRLFQDIPSAIQFNVTSKNHITIKAPQIVDSFRNKSQQEILPGAETVLDNKQANHIYIEPYRPLNLKTWTPETETDLYMIFGDLQDLTQFEYCCGASIDVVRRLIPSWITTKPDAILIDRISGNYLIAEFKLQSSMFIANHNRDDIDVLICWDDDAQDKFSLPRNVVCLKDVAANAAIEVLEGRR